MYAVREKLEYDSSLGGTVVLDTHVPTFRYAASTAKEIRTLLLEIKHPTGTKLAFQTLPKHMRRRAMSHHTKRLPRKYRNIHRHQMAKAGKPEVTKRPSRKYRRRPRNLLKEYARRQRRHAWLETHIWHARRFHMIERWGYRLPLASCDKTYRACYRATASHCLLQDISYYACLELEASVEVIRDGFRRLTSDQCGLTITARTYVSGRREGTIHIFRDSQYPAGAVGSVSFMWRPVAETEAAEAGKRTLWLWMHPSIYQPLLEELIKVFALVSMKSVKEQLDQNDVMLHEVPMSATPAQGDCAAATASRRLQFMTRTLAFERNKRYMNETQSIQLLDLKDTINRFRLTGPLSQAVLSHALKATTTAPSAPQAAPPQNWFAAWLQKEPHQLDAHRTQANYWQQCGALSSPGELLSNMIIGLNVDDPRVHRPQKRSKALPQTQTAAPDDDDLHKGTGSLGMGDSPPCLPHSALWEGALRDRVRREMLSAQAYCELRAKHAIVPGGACRFEQELQPLPLLLVQRPGCQNAAYKRLGYGCGWDVIVPAGYGMTVWLSLIMWGAKPGGLKESDTVAREMGTEQHLPDTVPGQQTAAERHVELRAKYFRLPPNKRCNYRKFSVASPFRVPFRELVRDWQPTAQTPPGGVAYHVLRDRRLLLAVQSCLARCTQFPDEIPPDALIQLQITMKTRGNPHDYALLCLPTLADLRRNLKRIKRESHEPIHTEPLLSDPNERERKVLRTQHKQLLKRLRARRVREKLKKQETSSGRVHIRPAATAPLVAQQFAKMCALWLPEDCATLLSVRKQCSRDVFGYVTNANFSYTEATVCAVGYVAAAGLRQLHELCRLAKLRQPMLLVRDSQSRHYRLATFKLNLEV